MEDKGGGCERSEGRLKPPGGPGNAATQTEEVAYLQSLEWLLEGWRAHNRLEEEREGEKAVLEWYRREGYLE